MLSALLKFFQAPAFADETRNRRARLLSFLINLHFVVAFSVAILYATVIYRGHIFPWVALASCLPALGARWLMRRGQVTPAAVGFICFLGVLMPATAYVGHSSVVSVAVTVFQFVSIVMAGLLLDGRGVVGYVAFTLLLNMILLYAEIQGLYPVDESRDPVLNWLMQIVAYSAAAALIASANRSIRDSLAHANRELAERRSTETRLARRAEEMYLLYKMGIALTHGEDLYHALRALVKELRRLMTVDAFYVVIYDEATDMLSYPLYLNLDDDLHVPSRKLSPNPGLTGEVLATRKTLHLPDISQPEVQKAHKIVVIVDMGVHAYIGIPLLIGDRIIGVLSVQAREPNAYSIEQVQLLETVAAQVAITVERSQLLERLQQELVERKRIEAEVRQLNVDLEARVEARTAELAAANRELESFSYSISHDLRAPLRGIDGFSRLLLDEYAGRIDAQGQRYLERVRTSAQRMSQLIDDLLAFARLSRLPLTRRPVDTAQLTREIWEEIKPPRDSHPVEFVVGPLPPCQADPALLRQVFVNLLDNAIKYSSTRPVARIEVGWREGAYFVCDNGVGFDMRYIGKLFGVFQRLHRMEEFEGTGVGLATVKRIIDRHGGRIWAESQLEQGATFFFSLPDEPPD